VNFNIFLVHLVVCVICNLIIYFCLNEDLMDRLALSLSDNLGYFQEPRGTGKKESKVCQHNKEKLKKKETNV